LGKKKLDDNLKRSKDHPHSAGMVGPWFWGALSKLCIFFEKERSFCMLSVVLFLCGSGIENARAFIEGEGDEYEYE